MRFHNCVLTVFCMLLVGSEHVFGDETFFADGDTYINEEFRDNSFCVHPSLKVGVDGNYEHRFYVRWENIGDSLPPGTEVTDVSIHLEQQGQPDTGQTVDVFIRRVSSGWSGECQPTWNDQPDCQFLALGPYAVPGLTGGTRTVIFENDPQDELLNYVQSVVDGPDDAVELCFHTATFSSHVQFYSSEGPSFALPKLVVDCIPPLQPDLVVEDIWTEPATPVAGEPFTLFGEVCNDGIGDAEDVVIQFQFDENLECDPSRDVEQGECETEDCSGITVPTAGEYEFCVYAVPHPNEDNPGNNVMCVDIDVNPAPEPMIDVTPPSIDFGNTSAECPQCQIVTIWNNGDGELIVDEWLAANVEVFNSGHWQPAPSSIFELTPANPPGGTGDVIVAPGDSSTFEVCFLPAFPNPYRADLIVRSNDQTTPDAVVNLNGMGVPDCPADVNCSGAVNVDDLLALLSNWGSNGPGADIAGDLDIINVADLLGMLSNWGACPS